MTGRSLISRAGGAALFSIVALAQGAGADASRALGSNTGDGSTAFTGLAQAPEANLFVGAATTAIPIEVPPGRKNLTPKLALTYSSAGGPSPYGYGWDLPLGKIQRSTKHGVLSCADPTYRNDFVLVLPAGTVECRLDQSVTPNRCVPTVEESFLRILYTPNQWDVWDKSGLHYTFGATNDERTGSNVNALFSPGNPCTYTFSWLLNRIEDPNGNYATIGYLHWGLPYPGYILYGGSGTAGQYPSFEISFGYMNRPDYVTNGMGGFDARLTELLTSIDVHSDRLVRSYRFQYEFQTNAPRLGRQSFLTAVTLVDGNGQALQRFDHLPASTTFLYQENGPEQGRFGFTSAQPATKAVVPLPDPLAPNPMSFDRYDRTLGDNLRDVMDVNGDGIPDLVTLGACWLPGDGHWQVFLGTKAGFSTTPLLWNAGSDHCSLRYTHTQVDEYTGEGYTITYSDTVDINGDGIPDWVDASTRPTWSVYLGHADVNGSGWGFATTATPWPAPLPYVRRSLLNQTIIPGNLVGNVDTQDLIDINGDGLPDLVDGSQDTLWMVYLNTGSGFETTGTQFYAPATFLRLTDARSGAELIGLYDINGDGLPDQVLADFGPANTWQVYLNSGHGMVSEQTWTFPSTRCGRQGLRVSVVSNRDASVVRDLIDINGDGLPDIVDVCDWPTTGAWYVTLNRGNGFSGQLLSWSAPAGVIRQIETDDVRNRTTSADTFDADGDGLVDFVDFAADASNFLIYHNGGGAWLPGGQDTVLANPFGGRPDLLMQVENGVGSTVNLEYRPSTQWLNTDTYGTPHLPFVLWTVTRIEQDDGLTGVSGGSHELSTNYSYAYGRYQPAAREFRGFGTVEQRDVDGNLRTTWFRQDAVRKGKTYSINSYAAGPQPYSNLLVYTYQYWDCASPTTGGVLTCPDVLAAGQRSWVRLAEADQIDATNYSLAKGKQSFTQNASWDAYGNVTHSVRGGTGTTSVHTYAEYITHPNALRYIVDRSHHTWVVSGAKLEEKWFTYDGLWLGAIDKGNVTAVWSWIDTVVDAALPGGTACPGGSGKCATTTMVYDGPGNITTVTDANGNTTTTVYDRWGLYPQTVTNALNQTVATVYDPGCGKLVSRTEVTGATTQYRYDSFCRLAEVIIPDANPYREYAYYLGAPGQPTDVHIREIEPNAPWGGINRDELFDAFGRHLQTQRDGVVDGRSVIIAEGTVGFDARGNVQSRYAPFTTWSAFDGDAVLFQQPPSAARTFQHDALNRITQVTNPDGSQRSMSYDTAWQTVAKDECYLAGNCPGGKTIEIVDAFGRLIDKQLYNGDTFDTRTHYDYDGMDRVIAVTQGKSPTQLSANTKVATTYDSLGRKLQVNDPDSGLWKYGYDLIGNVLLANDPTLNQSVQMCYDALNRVVGKYYNATDQFQECATASNPVAVYQYDQGGTNHTGRLTHVVDQSGDTTLAYDSRGRTSSVRTGIKQSSGLGAPVVYGETTYRYDTADHVKTITYLDGEQLKYTYDAAGQVETVEGNAPNGTPLSYLTNETYDVFGRPRQITHGNGVADTYSYAGSGGNFRLAQIASNGVQRLNYSYQANGLLSQITDTGSGGPLSTTAAFTYDGLGRLTQATDNNSYTYGDNLDNLTSKDGVAFTYGGTSPHQVTSAIGGLMAYDANGNRTSKGAGQTYSYDPEGRLSQLTVGNRVLAFMYDFTGQRVWASDNQGLSRRYYGNLAEVTDAALTKYYFVGRMRIASQRVAAPLALAGLPPDPAVRLASDPHGRSLLLVVALRRDIQLATAALAVLGVAVLLMVPGKRKAVVGITVRRGHVLLVIAVFGLNSLPLPILVQAACASGGGGGRTPTPTLVGTPTPLGGANSWGVKHYHHDHLGSTQAITNSDGSVFLHIRYKPYGEVRGYFDQAGNPVAAHGEYRHEFTDYETLPVSGLQYAGARFYDPSLATFLTHDPARQFANPYTYTSWNPANVTDPNGEFVVELLTALVIAVVVSAAVNSVIAAVQGASLVQIGEAAAMGAATGAVSVGLGVVAGGVGIGAAALAGTLPEDVGLQQALNALGEVAYRSAFSAITANAVGQTAAAAGAPSGAVMGLSMAAGLGGSYAFDSYFINPTGDLARVEGRGAFQKVSNTATHTEVTSKAAEVAGFNQSETEVILENNLAQDLELANNQGHFGFGAQDAFKRFAGAALEGKDLRYVGAASHYIQDQYALGHIFPGTNFLGGLVGAPFRFLIHQTVGGEVNFFGIAGGLRIPSSFDATLDYFSAARRYIPSGTAL